MKSTEDIIRQIKDGTLREDVSVELKRWIPNKDMMAKVLVGLANVVGGNLVHQPNSSRCSKLALHLASTPSSVVPH